MIKDRQGKIVKELEGQNKLLKKLYSTSIGRCALKILVSPWITYLGGIYMSSKLSTLSIPSFIKNNDIDMSQYVDKKYVSYNDFFTRMIKDGKRNFDSDELVLCAPADSKLTYYKLTKDTILEIKDTKYKLKDLLEDDSLAKEYENGICLVFRLAVDDYHRYSYVDDGLISFNKKIKGVFHTVNPIANDYYPIYKMNSREYTVIETKHFDKLIQMEVGAMMVGKIINHKHLEAIRGKEKGYFEFGGSTVVLILKDGVVNIDEDIILNSSKDIETRVLLGERIGYKGV